MSVAAFSTPCFCSTPRPAVLHAGRALGRPVALPPATAPWTRPGLSRAVSMAPCLACLQGVYRDDGMSVVFSFQGPEPLWLRGLLGCCVLSPSRPCAPSADFVLPSWNLSECPAQSACTPPVDWVSERVRWKRRREKQRPSRHCRNGRKPYCHPGGEEDF